MEGFDEFVAASLPRLLGLAHGLAGNSHDAWDLCQGALARVGARWRHVDRLGNPYGYARRTIVRLNIYRLRLRHREWPVSEPLDQPHLAAAPVGLDPWLAEVITTLSSRQRTAIVLRYGEDLDVTNVAAAMGCSLGTAKSQLSRAVERLRGHVPSATKMQAPMSFDDELRSQAKSLVAPRRPPWQAASDIARAVGVKRRSRRRGVFTTSAAVVALLASGGAWVTRSHDTVTAASHVPVTVQFRAGLGVEAHFRLSFAEDRRVSSAMVTNEGINARSSYYPLDGSGSDQSYPNPLPLPAGTQMEFDAVVVPACGRQDPGDVVLQVSSLRPNGDSVSDRFGGVDAAQFRRVTHQYCTQETGVHIQGSLSRGWPDGRATFLLFVTNPAAHPVTVRSQAYTRGEGQWQAASIVVQSRTTRALTIHARNVLDRTCPSSAPWATRHLTVDGKPVRLDQQESGCE